MEPISITFILEWNYLTLHVTRYSPAVVGTAHLHNGKGAVGLRGEKKKSTRWQRLCAHTLCVIRQRSGKFMRPLLHSFPVWQHFITEVPTQPGKIGHASVRFSQLTLVEVGRTISWLHYDTVTQMQLLLGMSGSVLSGKFSPRLPNGLASVNSENSGNPKAAGAWLSSDR